MKDYDPTKQSTSAQSNETLLAHVSAALDKAGLCSSPSAVKRMAKAIANDCGGEPFDELLKRAGDGRLR